MTVAIEYPHFREEVDAVQVGPGVWRLRGFSHHMPLAPGDLVLTNGRSVSGVRELRDVFIVEAFLEIGTSQAEVDQKLRAWGAATDVQQVTGLTVLVASSSREWVRETIKEDPDVVLMEVWRVPSELFSFDRAKEEA